MKAVEFDKWFEGEMPNSHKKVNKERIETVIYSCAEAAWDFQQSKIDALEVQLKGAEERAKLTLDHKNRMVDELQKENDRLNTWYKNVKLQLENKQIDCNRSDRETDELRARVGRALKNVEMAFDKKDWVVVEAIRILKGNKDEN